MNSKAKLLGHPVHPILVAFPVGLFVTSLVFDLIRMAGGSEGFSVAAFYMIGAGIVGALAAAIFGFVDYLFIPRRTRAKRIGLMHGSINLLMVALFIVSWSGRYADPAAFLRAPIAISAIAVVLALVSGWLGGELVDGWASASTTGRTSTRRARCRVGLPAKSGRRRDRCSRGEPDRTPRAPAASRGPR